MTFSIRTVSDPGSPPLPPPPTPEQRARRQRDVVAKLLEEQTGEEGEVINEMFLMIKDRSWSLLKRGDGKFFESFEQMIEWKRPYGCGMLWKDCAHLVERAFEHAGVVNPKKEIDLGTVAPAKAPGSEQNKQGGKFTAKTDGDIVSLSDKKAQKRNRAILRSPEPAQQLYKADLLSVVLAAKLGPKNPSPELAAKVTEIAIAGDKVAKEHKALEPRKLRTKVNETVRTMLGGTSAYQKKSASILKMLLSHDNQDVLEAMRDWLLKKPKAQQMPAWQALRPQEAEEDTTP